MNHKHSSVGTGYGGAKAGGLTRKRWCDSNGIQLSTYAYRCKKVCRILKKRMQEQQDTGIAMILAECEQAQLREPVFAKVDLQAPQSAASGIHIRLSNAEVAIAPDTLAEHVRMVLEALSYAYLHCLRLYRSPLWYRRSCGNSEREVRSESFFS